jgi:hypothetical protein
MKARMHKKVLSLFIGLWMLAGSAVAVSALTLESIGVTTVGGKSISSWYYQGFNPVFTGTADPSAAVTVSIDGVEASTTSDESGAWSYTPTTLTEVQLYPVVITSGTQSLSFNLDITGSGGTASTTTTTKGGLDDDGLALPDELPLSGSLGLTLAMVVTGLGMMLVGLYLHFIKLPGWLMRRETA